MGVASIANTSGSWHCSWPSGKKMSASACSVVWHRIRMWTVETIELTPLVFSFSVTCSLSLGLNTKFQRSLLGRYWLAVLALGIATSTSLWRKAWPRWLLYRICKSTSRVGICWLTTPEINCQQKIRLLARYICPISLRRMTFKIRRLRVSLTMFAKDHNLYNTCLGGRKITFHSPSLPGG